MIAKTSSAHHRSAFRDHAKLTGAVTRAPGCARLPFTERVTGGHSFRSSGAPDLRPVTNGYAEGSMAQETANAKFQLGRY
jgi:hypothetical protein